MKHINKNSNLITHPCFDSDSPYIINKKSIQLTNYINQLKTILEDITILNWIINQFKLKLEQRDFIIKFKLFTSKENFYFNHSIFEDDNIGKWYNFIYTLSTNKFNSMNFKHLLFRENNNLLLANDYNFKKSLFLFYFI